MIMNAVKMSAVWVHVMVWHGIYDQEEISREKYTKRYKAITHKMEVHGIRYKVVKTMDG